MSEKKLFPKILKYKHHHTKDLLNNFYFSGRNITFHQFGLERKANCNKRNSTISYLCYCSVCFCEDSIKQRTKRQVTSIAMKRGTLFITFVSTTHEAITTFLLGEAKSFHFPPPAAANRVQGYVAINTL